MLMIFLVNFIVFFFGLSVGSFLNCVLYRLDLTNFSFWKKLGGLNRSHCPSCNHVLAWYDLIPLVSFFLLGAKCRYCHKKISWQYPIIEISTALIFLLIFNQNTYLFEITTRASVQIFNLSTLVFSLLNLFFLFYLASSLIVIFVYDLKHYIIPDVILFPAIAVALFYRIIDNLFNFVPLSNYLFAALITAGFFLAIYLISKGKWL